MNFKRNPQSRHVTIILTEDLNLTKADMTHTVWVWSSMISYDLYARSFVGLRFRLKFIRRKQNVKTHAKIAFSAGIQTKLFRLKICFDLYTIFILHVASEILSFATRWLVSNRLLLMSHDSCRTPTRCFWFEWKRWMCRYKRMWKWL